MDNLKEIRQEFPKIVAYGENDLDWDNQGYQHLKEKELNKGEMLFKKLCLSQPEHSDGFAGLAHTYYLKGEKEKSLWFMAEAIKRARFFVEEGSMDREVLEMMKDDYEKIKNNEAMTSKWWMS